MGDPLTDNIARGCPYPKRLTGTRAAGSMTHAMRTHTDGCHMEAAMRKTVTILLALVLALAAAGCGSNDDGVVRIVFAAGQDPSGATKTLVEEFNAANPGVEVTFQVMPTNTDTQHDAYVTYLSARESSIDLYTLDVIWTAEFARAGWIRPLPPDLVDTDAFLAGPLESATYDGTLYAVPWFTDAGVLYYRKDILNEAGLDVPETWDALVGICRERAASDDMDGFVWQGARYEGLVCNFLEFLWGVGGSVDAEAVASDPASVERSIRDALDVMALLIEDDSVSPRSVLTYKEEDARRLFTEGRALFLRNWPYAWSFVQEEGSKVRDAVGIARLPHAEGAQSYSTIGGWNIALSSYSKHPEEALEFLRFITGERSLELRAIEGGYLPTRRATYEDPDVLAVNPHFASFFEVFEATRNRPRSPHYPRISDVIQENVHGALSGEVSHDDAAHAIVASLEEYLLDRP